MEGEEVGEGVLAFAIKLAIFNKFGGSDWFSNHLPVNFNPSELEDMVQELKNDAWVRLCEPEHPQTSLSF